MIEIGDLIIVKNSVSGVGAIGLVQNVQNVLYRRGDRHERLVVVKWYESNGFVFKSEYFENAILKSGWKILKVKKNFIGEGSHSDE